MKKIMLILATVVFTTATAFSVYAPKAEPKTENVDCQYGQCVKIKDDGYRCKNCCQQYSSYCWSHSR